MRPGEAGEIDEARSALYTAPGTCTGFVSSGAHITDYTAHSISAVRWQLGLTLTQYRAGIGPHPNGENAPSCYFAPVPSQMFSLADIADNAPLFPGSSDRVATIAVFGLDL